MFSPVKSPSLPFPPQIPCTLEFRVGGAPCGTNGRDLAQRRRLQSQLPCILGVENPTKRPGETPSSQASLQSSSHSALVSRTHTLSSGIFSLGTEVAGINLNTGLSASSVSQPASFSAPTAPFTSL